MDAKEYLGQVKSREARIRNLRRDRESSRNNDKFGTLYGRIDEMEKEIDSQITDLMRFQLKVSMEINELKTDKYMTVLNCRYIHFMSWEKIAESAFDVKYTVRHILKMHGYALLEFQEIHGEMLAEMDAGKSAAVSCSSH